MSPKTENEIKRSIMLQQILCYVGLALAIIGSAGAMYGIVLANTLFTFIGILCCLSGIYLVVRGVDTILSRTSLLMALRELHYQGIRKFVEQHEEDVKKSR